MPPTFPHNRTLRYGWMVHRPARRGRAPPHTTETQRLRMGLGGLGHTARCRRRGRWSTATPRGNGRRPRALTGLRASGGPTSVDQPNGCKPLQLAHPWARRGCRGCCCPCGARSWWLVEALRPWSVFPLVFLQAKETHVRVLLGLLCLHSAVFAVVVRRLLGAAGTLALAEKHVLCQGGPGGGERVMEAVREDKPPGLVEQLWAGLNASDTLRDPDGDKGSARAEWTCPRRTRRPR